jgi:anti-sigma B factor antagonist
MDASFMVTNRRSGCCEVIEMTGDLDLATAPHLEAVIDRMMVIPDHLIVDMSRLTFIDSTGLRLLLRASTLVEGRIWLKGCSRHVLRLLDVSGLSELFCLEQDRLNGHRAISKGRAARMSGSDTGYALRAEVDIRPEVTHHSSDHLAENFAS